MNLVEAFENKIVHSLKLMKEVHTKLFIVSRSYEDLSI
jgi:hypothetical protein